MVQFLRHPQQDQPLRERFYYRELAHGSTTMSAVLSIHKWKSNAELIRDIAGMGRYLKSDWLTLDPTYGYGNFWTLWKPNRLVAHDLNPAKAPDGPVDFTFLPYKNRSFDCVVFDPPYKLNGTPELEMDETYGVEEATNWRERMSLVESGIAECARVLGKGYLLLKCMDQVCSGKMRWQTDVFTRCAESHGLGKVDRFDMLSYRAQPKGRSQQHARRNASTLLVFKRGHKSE